MTAPGRDIHVAPWTGTWEETDKDANFKADVVLYAHTDPTTTLDNLSAEVGVPVGGLVHYILARWSSAGAAALLEFGPSVVKRMWEQAEHAVTDEEKIEAFDALKQMIAWLRIPLTE